jgi:hypothetical protein
VNPEKTIREWRCAGQIPVNYSTICHQYVTFLIKFSAKLHHRKGSKSVTQKAVYRRSDKRWLFGTLASNKAPESWNIRYQQSFHVLELESRAFEYAKMESAQNSGSNELSC